MFIDDTVIASLIVVGGSLAFFGAIWLFIYQASQEHKRDTKHSH